ncbi:MAG: relaxase/mobilization nuclease domain-containing protein [Bacilli bacterium]|jgi:hypothetical protein|nr:relaxase/mobilization nuclease domain-containing protein [Bacilli bacterium]
MATTSIWSIKGWLGKVVIYVENPDKTMHPEIAKLPELPCQEERELQGLSDVISYAVREEKIRQRQKEEKQEDGETETIYDEAEGAMQQYVSGVNCTPTTARSEMMAVKQKFGKDGGIMAFHGYQSFAPGECTPSMAHEIGVKLARELWGSRFQVLVATHLDKAHHLHNHFVVNSVSFIDGKRYHWTKQDYRDMRNASDRLCLEYQLSVIENPKQGQAKHYAEWKAQKEGKPTYRGMVKADVDEAIGKARTEKQFFHYLKEMGYSIKFGKDVTICPKGRERGLKLARNFGEDYTIASIRRRILAKPVEKPRPKSLQRQQKSYTIEIKGTLHQARRIGGLRGLYLHYCYQLGILPRHRTTGNPKQVHMLFREDLKKLDTVSKETRLLCRYHIDTAEQLFSRRETLKGQILELSDTRKHLRYKIRSIKDSGQQSEVKAEISCLTQRIGELRKEVGLCDGIAARSGVVKEKLQKVRQENIQQKEGRSHEHIRRSR